MKTYSETQGKKFFDWNQFLENPPLFSSEKHLDACDLSCEWVTCACGNLCDIIPRNRIGAPKDYHLEKLGMMFHQFIDDGEWQKAKETLAKIEKRSEELIAKLS